MFGRQLVLLEHVYTFTTLHSITSQEANYDDNLLFKINVDLRKWQVQSCKKLILKICFKLQ